LHSVALFVRAVNWSMNHSVARWSMQSVVLAPRIVPRVAKISTKFQTIP